MKKVLLFSLLGVVSLQAQQSADQALLTEKLFLVFDFMDVKAAQLTDYLEVEDFWKGIHQQRVKRGDIIGWDLWSITPGGQKQGSQYLTVSLHSSFANMIKGVSVDEITADAKNAYPDKSDTEIEAMIAKTGLSREIAYQLMLERIDFTKDQFDMPIGTIATMGAMQQLKSGYEKAETEIFKPWHQSEVDAGTKGTWAIARIIFPAGTDRYATHLVFNMFKDSDQYAKWSERNFPELDFNTQQAVSAGLETRDLKSIKLLTLIDKVR